MLISYIQLGISLSLGSWLIGLILNGICSKFPFYSRLSYFNFVPNKTTNKQIGIYGFKWIIEHSFFRYFNRKICIQAKNTNFNQLRKEMTYAEIGHLIAFVIVSAAAIYYSIQKSIVLGFIIMFFNVLLNLYPSLLQQENKRRLDKIIEKTGNRP